MRPPLRPRPAACAAAALAVLTLAAGARPAASQARPAANTAAAAPAGPFTVSGRYALVLMGENLGTPFTVPFTVVVTDSAGRWVGQFIGSNGRARPLVAVVPRPAERAVVVQYQDGSGFATMLLRVQGDSVRGATEYADGTFQIRGTRGPAGAAPAAAAAPAPK